MKVLVFKDSKGEWRWTLKARNGRKIATCGEGYKNRAHCARMVAKLFPGVKVEVEE
jgi:uncharacterized protein YegP (UPF0339 family)